MHRMLRHLAAKTGDRSGEWLPLWLHLADTACVAEYLLTHFLSDSFKEYEGFSPELLRKTVLFLAYAHDIGKATALFQSRITQHLPLCRERLIADGVSVPACGSFLNQNASKGKI